MDEALTVHGKESRIRTEVCRPSYLTRAYKLVNHVGETNRYRANHATESVRSDRG